MRRYVKTGVFQRLDQEAAHIVVVFGEEDFMHDAKAVESRLERINPNTKPAEGKFRVKGPHRGRLCEDISVLESVSMQR
jgi:hypothetical protein